MLSVCVQHRCNHQPLDAQLHGICQPHITFSLEDFWPMLGWTCRCGTQCTWEGNKRWKETVTQEANREALDKTHVWVLSVLAGIFTLDKFRRNHAYCHCARLHPVCMVSKHFLTVVENSVFREEKAFVFFRPFFENQHFPLSLSSLSCPLPLAGSVASAIQKAGQSCLQSIRKLYCPQHAAGSIKLKQKIKIKT